MTKDRILVVPAASDPAVRSKIIERSRARGFRGFVIPPGPSVAAAPGETWWVRTARGLRPRGGSSRGRMVPLISVRAPRELERALTRAVGSDGIALRWLGDRIIPLETALMRGQRRFAIWVATDRIEEVPGALGALERGADRVLVELATPEEVEALERTLEGSIVPALGWCRATIDRVAAAGTSERVIVDTTSLLAAHEGLLIGSSAGLLFHVESETVGSRYTRPRPFRVNAGSPHSYVLMADGTTRYLSELEAGDAVLVVAPKGPGRAVRVGRLKIERRPMVLVAARSSDRVGTIFLQEAETVRLTSDRGPVPSTAVRIGMRLIGVALPRARHLGVEIQESVEER